MFLQNHYAIWEMTIPSNPSASNYLHFCVIRVFKKVVVNYASIAKLKMIIEKIQYYTYITSE